MKVYVKATGYSGISTKIPDILVDSIRQQLNRWFTGDTHVQHCPAIDRIGVGSSVGLVTTTGELLMVVMNVNQLLEVLVNDSSVLDTLEESQCDKIVQAFVEPILSTVLSANVVDSKEECLEIKRVSVPFFKKICQYAIACEVRHANRIYYIAAFSGAFSKPVTSSLERFTASSKDMFGAEKVKAEICFPEFNVRVKDLLSLGEGQVLTSDSRLDNDFQLQINGKNLAQVSIASRNQRKVAVIN
jgi:hypothetical protein